MAFASRSSSLPRRRSSRRCASRSRMPSKGRGLLFIVSAPSGAGKTTLVERLVEQTPHLRMSRSYTSRPAREGEKDGGDYKFVNPGRVEGMVAVREVFGRGGRV